MRLSALIKAIASSGLMVAWLVLLKGGVFPAMAQGMPKDDFASHGSTSQSHMETDGATYQNPFLLDQEWPNYGIGDPFILRWNGRFYLYSSTNTHGGGSVGIRAWRSHDLVNWEYQGYVTRESVTWNAYAPEVIYWDGLFYMATSPNGQGHYILTSESPTGPFTVQTDNLGLSIDGSFFIDDDGQWYFTRSGHRGIRGHRMADPFTMGPEIILESDLGGWTEGSYILKRDGVYFLTYTGNHVTSRGYRVHYSVSQDGPLGPYQVPEDNLIIISTKDDFHGLGHSATVMGPDLDSYYITYHNITNRLGAHRRRLNIDRLVFNGTKMDVLGPTNTPQPVPPMPAFYTWVDEEGLDKYWQEGRWKDREILHTFRKTKSSFTAEYNFQLKTGDLRGDKPAEAEAEVGAIFSYQDEATFRYASVDVRRHQLTVASVEDGEISVLATADLPGPFDYTKLHTLRVIQGPNRLQVYFDNLLQVDLPDVKGMNGAIGYMHRNVEPVFRFTAFSHEAQGSSDFHAFKPIPGTIEAVHYGNYHTKGDSSFAFPKNDNPIRYGDETDIQLTGDGSYSVRLHEPGDWLTYLINVTEDGLYAVDFTIKRPHSAAELDIFLDDTPIGTAIITGAPGTGPNTESETESETGFEAASKAGSEYTHGADDTSDSDCTSGTESVPVFNEDWFKVRGGHIELKQGLHTLRFQLTSGNLEFRHMDLYKAETAPYGTVEGLTAPLGEEWSIFGEGDWLVTESGHRAPGSSHFMAITGSDDWTDVRVQVDLAFDGQVYPGEAGLIVRAMHPSHHPSQVEDALVGYYISTDGHRLNLKKLRYNSRTLVEVPIDAASASTHQLKVEVVEHTIRIFWNDMENPVIEYTDSDALMHGSVGFRSNTAGVLFRNFSAECISCPIYGAFQLGDRRIAIHPGISRYTLELPFHSTEPPQVQLLPPDDLPQDALIDPNARIHIIPAQSIPGQMKLQVESEDGTHLHSLIVKLEKVETPSLAMSIDNQEPMRHGWAGAVFGQVSLSIEVDGPDELLTNVQVTLGQVISGEVRERTELYAGTDMPRHFSLDTNQFEDGTYELAAEVTSIYNTHAKSSIRFAIENWTELVDDLQPPLDGWFGPVDRTETTSKTDGWEFAVDSPDMFFGDAHRMVRSGPSTESLTWSLPGLYDFTLTLYARNRNVDDAVSKLKENVRKETVGNVEKTVRIDISADEATWTAADYKVDVADSTDEWLKLHITGKPPEDFQANYLRVTLTSSDLPADSVQLGRVHIRASSNR